MYPSVSLYTHPASFPAHGPPFFLPSIKSVAKGASLDRQNVIKSSLHTDSGFEVSLEDTAPSHVGIEYEEIHADGLVESNRFSPWIKKGERIPKRFRDGFYLDPDQEYELRMKESTARVAPRHTTEMSTLVRM